MGLKDIIKSPEDNNQNLILHIDILSFIEYLGEKYSIDTEKEWKIYCGD
jgi:hypothetical protein